MCYDTTCKNDGTEVFGVFFREIDVASFRKRFIQGRCEVLTAHSEQDIKSQSSS